MTEEIIIEAGRAERHYWRDLWHYRELFRVLAWRNVAVRYKQTVIGAAWAFIRPFLTMVVFTVIFGKLANLPSEGTAPYSIMVFTGMLPWIFFSSALSDASNRLVSNANLIDKSGALVGNFLAWRARFEPHTCHTLRRLIQRSETFIDIGANICFYSVLAKRIAPQIEVMSF